jgi:hypothetical protein
MLLVFVQLEGAQEPSGLLTLLPTLIHSFVSLTLIIFDTLSFVSRGGVIGSWRPVKWVRTASNRFASVRVAEERWIRCASRSTDNEDASYKEWLCEHDLTKKGHH